MTYREYAELNGHYDTWLEQNTNGLFDADSEMVYIKSIDTADIYDICGYTYYSNYSSCDTIEHIKNGEVIEYWSI